MTANRRTLSFDVVVVGSGVAGATVALRCAGQSGARVALVTKANLDESNTRYAQGGIAVARALGDNVELHLSDTINAGAGLVDPTAARVLVEEAPEALEELIEIGARFDRAPDGSLRMSREGGHSVARVVHAGGAATGAEVIRGLEEALRHSAVELFDQTFTADLLVEQGRCVGITAIDPSGTWLSMHADVVVLATGGAGQLFDVTTNPLPSTGDGVAMALRAGVAVADVEFVQFHPTALHIERWPRPLLSEALRGAGATLRNASHDRFVDELASRDVVSRAIANEIAASGIDHVFLDATGIGDFAELFPSIGEILSQVGLDPTTDLLPVAPAAHYECGGVLSDLDGSTTLPGLFAIGEVACSGVEGANRLASNSLLEGLVFARRAADAIASGQRSAERSGAMRGLSGAINDDAVPIRLIDDVVLTHVAARSDEPRSSVETVEVATARRELQRAMSMHAGVVRNEEGLTLARTALLRAQECAEQSSPHDVSARELGNLATIGIALVASALKRHESRGAHTRSDYLRRDDEHFFCRFGFVGPVARDGAVLGETDPR